jgi:hypothetical protein
MANQSSDIPLSKKIDNISELFKQALDKVTSHGIKAIREDHPYYIWCKKTGNKQNLTREDFEHLMERGLVEKLGL